MGGNGKHSIWKISFNQQQQQRQQQQQQQRSSKPPKELLCPISGALMSDPVVISSGQTFERVSIQVCRDLNFVPLLENGSRPDFTSVALIPNLAMRASIITWCDTNGTDHPRVPDYYSVEKIVRAMMDSDRFSSSSSCRGIRFSETELLKGVEKNPQVIFSHAATELGHRVKRFQFNSGSLEESEVVGGLLGIERTAALLTPPLPLKTLPACYSSNSMTYDRSSAVSPEEESLLSKLESSEINEQEEGVISLRKITKTREEVRISLCTPRFLSALKPLIQSCQVSIQTNAVASLVNLSLDRSNKVAIVRSGFVPLLIGSLKSESQEHAAGALFSLSLEDENKMAIGVLGGLQPLMETLKSESERARQDSALALYHLSLIPTNRTKLVKLGAVPNLLSLLNSNDSIASRILLVLSNLATCNEGRSAMLDADGVRILVSLLRAPVDSEMTQENCVAVLLGLSHGSLRFKGLAKEARAVEVLKEIEDSGSERAREKAKKILLMMRAREYSGEGQLDWEGVLLSPVGQSWIHHRVSANSSNF
ncbi:hypothetical protein ACFE04_006648 [Oxalis oulophora]